MFLDLFAFQSFRASISSLTLGGLLSAFILVLDQSWGQRRIGGFPCVFRVSYFFLFVPRVFFFFFRTSRLPCRNFLRARSLTFVWCDINGEPLSFVGPTVSAELVSKDPSLADLAQLRFRHPDYFQAGSLHDHVDFWEHLISSAGYVCPQVNLLQIIREGVRVHDFFRHFKGNFKGGHYNSAVPPIFRFPELFLLPSTYRFH